MRLCDVKKVRLHPPPTVTEWPSWHTSRAVIKTSTHEDCDLSWTLNFCPAVSQQIKNGFLGHTAIVSQGLLFYTLGRLMFEYFNRGCTEIGDLESFRKWNNLLQNAAWDSLRSKYGLFIIPWEILKVSQQVVITPDSLVMCKSSPRKFYRGIIIVKV